MSALLDTVPPGGKSLFPLRKRTGTAAFHLSSEAVDFGQEDLERLTPKQAVHFLADILWGSRTTMPCPHCGTIDAHYYRPKEMRWKCKCCDKTFSVTSGTVLHDRKLPLTKILKIAHSWANGASGKPALQLRRDWNVAYPTVFTLLHKLREGLARGFNSGTLCGVTEMDGMDVLGRRYREKRNKPQGGGRTTKPAVPAHLLKPEADEETGELVGPAKPPKWGKAARQPADRRLLLVMRQRGIAKGKGAVQTRVAVAITESTRTVTAMAQRYASAESVVMSDEDPAYASFGRLFAEHRTMNHSKGYSDGKGTNNNQAESFNRRMRRLVEGVYLNPSGRHLLSYAAEAAWREDSRRMSTGKKLKSLLGYALGVGLSQWWRGYTHGKHRETELRIDGEFPAPARGRPKGWEPKPPR
jgi:transposase-like protein